MKITAIGVGNLFSKKHFNTSFLVETNMGYKMLFDCGRTTPEAMLAQNLSWTDIDGVYISHQHADHVGGLEEFGFSRLFFPNNKGRPHLIVQGLLGRYLWEHTLRGGMEFCQNQIVTMDHYFDVLPLYTPEQAELFDTTPSAMLDENTICELVPTLHMSSGRHAMISYGLFLKSLAWHKKGGKSIMFTGDCLCQSKRMMPYFEKSDIIFHDCETHGWESNSLGSGCHAHYNLLKRQIPTEIKKKMWLCHYGDEELPNAREDGFAGFVQEGQQFEV